MFFGFICIFLLLIGFSIWFFIINPSNISNDKIKKEKIEKQLSDIREESNIYHGSDTYKEFADKINTFIKDNNPEKNILIELYQIKSIASFNSFNYDDCYDTTIKLDELSPDFSNTELIGDCLAGQGKKEEAIKYYEKAISMNKGDSDLDQLDKSSIWNKIVSLKASTQ